jgi:arylsulfatase A
MPTNLAWLLGVVTLVCCGSSPDDTPSPRPNIVLIISDYMSYGDTAPYGASDVATPNLDRLAAEGMRFTDFHSSAPLCGPSRASLLTGLYPARAGIESNVDDGQPGLLPDRTTIARRLRDAGYETAIVGKWHLGTGESGPNAHGFAHFLGFHEWTLDYYEHTAPSDEPGLWEDESPVTRDGYLTDVLTDEAVDFVRAPRDEPFFLYLAYNTALPPYQPPGLAPEERGDRWETASRADYAAMIESMDTGIGRVLAALDERGLTDDTLVVFTTDHGGGTLARPAPHSQGFLTLREGGVRVPLIARWPESIRAGSVSAQVGISMDLSATLLDAAGVALPTADDSEAFDGESLLPILEGTAPEHERTLFWRFTPKLGAGAFRTAVRQGRWKYIVETTAAGVSRGQLFDLDADPGEATNLVDREPAVRAALSEALKTWTASQPPGR